MAERGLPNSTQGGVNRMNLYNIPWISNLHNDSHPEKFGSRIILGLFLHSKWYYAHSKRLAFSTR